MTVDAAIYCRLSWAPDGSLEKVDRQEDDARQVAKRIGWRVPDQHVYKDNSASAWKRNRHRPGWDAMLDAIRAGEITGIIVYHGDRLIRQPYDLELLLQLADDRRLRLASVSGTKRLDHPDDRFVLRVEAAQACRESDNISRRVTRGWQARAERGLPAGGGKRPFGFEPDKITIREPEADILRGAAERLLAGQTFGGVVAWLNEIGATTSQGNPWNPRSLHHLLRSPRIAGLIERDGRKYEAAWEPIISPEDWQELNSLYEANAERYQYHGRQRRYLLSGIAECPDCGRGVGTKPSGGRNRKTTRIYQCRRCKSFGRNVEHLDEYVIGQTLAVLNRPRFRERLATAAQSDPQVGQEIAQLERRRETAKRQLEQLADHPDVDPGLVAKSLSSFSERIDELRAQQTATTRHRVLMRAAGIDRAGWDALPLDLRAEIVRALFRIVVLPATWRGPGFDPDSVKLTRRPLR